MTAIESQITRIEDVIERLSNTKLSVPDIDLETGVNSQHIASGGTGYQSNIVGRDHKIVSRCGKLFNVTVINSSMESD